MIEVLVHARAPFQRRDLAKEWVRILRTLRFASLVELKHALLQPLTFLREVTAGHLQFSCRWSTARKRAVVRQDMTNTWSDDSAQQGALGDELARGHLQCHSAMRHHLRYVHFSPQLLRGWL